MFQAFPRTLAHLTIVYFRYGRYGQVKFDHSSLRLHKFYPVDFTCKTQARVTAKPACSPFKRNVNCNSIATTQIEVYFLSGSPFHLDNQAEAEDGEQKRRRKHGGRRTLLSLECFVYQRVGAQQTADVLAIECNGIASRQGFRMRLRLHSILKVIANAVYVETILIP